MLSERTMIAYSSKKRMMRNLISKLVEYYQLIQVPQISMGKERLLHNSCRCPTSFRHMSGNLTATLLEIPTTLHGYQSSKDFSC